MLSLWPYAAVAFTGLVLDWFAQLGYFLYKTHLNPAAFQGQRTLFDYKTGFIGDLILLPLMNIAMLYVVLHSSVKLTRRHFVWVGACGLLADALLHFLQGYLKLTNWSMPAPFQWDFVSYWHMFSFFFQISFVFLFFYLAAKALFSRDQAVPRAVFVVFGCIGIFLALFMYDYLPVHAILAEVVARLHEI